MYPSMHLARGCVSQHAPGKGCVHPSIHLGRGVCGQGAYTSPASTPLLRRSLMRSVCILLDAFLFVMDFHKGEKLTSETNS